MRIGWFAMVGVILQCLFCARVNADVGVVGRDFKQLLAPQSLGLIAAGLGAAGWVHRWDDDMMGRFESNAILEATSYPSNLYGSSTFNLSAVLLLWGFAHATDRSELKAVSFDVLRALLTVQAVVGPIKYGVGRERPDRSNNLSFPSGHTANAFALAGVLGRRYGRKAGIPLYAFSVLVGMGRMEDDRHYLSDVVGGAAIGMAIGLAITQTESQKLTVLPGQHGVQLVLNF